MSAAAGERNQLVVTLTDVIRVADSVPLEAGEGCRKEPDGRVACDLSVPGTPYAYVDAGDQDDEVRFDIGRGLMEISVDGGDGDDLLIGGGTGENTLTGGSGDDRMVGGAGRNEFLEGASANGSDRFEARGSYGDSVRYDARGNGLRVELDGEANDGEPGEHDFVSPAVTTVYAGQGADVLVGNDGANGLVGAAGADVIRGAGGNDQLIGSTRLYGRVGSDDRLYGGAGADRISGGAGDDLLAGGPGRDDIDAFSGADRLLPGTGRDSVRAGPGGDLIDARDRSADAVGCGRGDDTVRNDRIDSIHDTCEHHDMGRRLSCCVRSQSLTGIPAARIRSFASRTVW
jgi:Ca2+-binding RTX toxin-like protein